MKISEDTKAGIKAILFTFCFAITMFIVVPIQYDRYCHNINGVWHENIVGFYGCSAIIILPLTAMYYLIIDKIFPRKTK